MTDEAELDLARLIFVQMTVSEALGLVGEFMDAEQAGHPWCEDCAAVAQRLGDQVNEPAPQVYTAETPWGWVTSTAPITYTGRSDA